MYVCVYVYLVLQSHTTAFARIFFCSIHQLPEEIRRFSPPQSHVRMTCPVIWAMVVRTRWHRHAWAHGNISKATSAGCRCSTPPPSILVSHLLCSLFLHLTLYAAVITWSDGRPVLRLWRCGDPWFWTYRLGPRRLGSSSEGMSAA